MNFINVRLLTDNLPAALDFWQEVMQYTAKFADESMGYAYFETDTAGIEIMTREGFAQYVGKPILAPTPSILVFKVDNVDATYADLVKRGAVEVVEPKSNEAIGIRSASVSDPDGNFIEIYSPMNQA